MEIGIKGFSTITVTDELTAAKVGSGCLPVFSTPSMIALLEKAACECIKDKLDDGMSSVGTFLDIKHIAATPVSMTVTAEATLIEIDGRRLVFDIKVNDEAGLIGQGKHERFIVNSEKFVQRTNAKLK